MPYNGMSIARIECKRGLIVIKNKELFEGVYSQLSHDLQEKCFDDSTKETSLSKKHCIGSGLKRAADESEYTFNVTTRPELKSARFPPVVRFSNFVILFLSRQLLFSFQYDSILQIDLKCHKFARLAKSKYPSSTKLYSYSFIYYHT